MSKKWFAAVVGLMAIMGTGAAADAGVAGPTISPSPQTIPASQSFQVTYRGCSVGQDVQFRFEALLQTVPCEVPIAGIRRLPSALVGQTGPGTATASFTAPATAGTYQGTATPVQGQPVDLQGFRRPAAGSLPTAGALAPQVMLMCPDVVGCLTFVVIVPEPETTTTTTTTLAPTTTLAATTTAAAAVPPAPTTTAAVTSPVLPATGRSRNDNVAVIAVALLAAGGALIVASRWRGGHTPS